MQKFTEYQGIKIKPKSKFWILPWFKNTSTALYPNIYLPRALYTKLLNNEDLYLQSTVIHESTHIKRQKEQGVVWWYLKYLFIPKFRYNEELEAIKPQFRFLNENGLELNIEKRAKALSSYMYLWCVRYENAYNDLTKLK